MLSKLSLLSAIAAVLALTLALPASGNRVHKKRAHISMTSNSTQVVVQRGQPVQIAFVDAPCGDATADLPAAASIVANAQNVGVLGPFCSTADAVMLPVFQPADLVTISGSTTDPSLSA